jgi:hypothetical protein
VREDREGKGSDNYEGDRDNNYRYCARDREPEGGKEWTRGFDNAMARLRVRRE